MATSIQIPGPLRLKPFPAADTDDVAVPTGSMHPKHSLRVGFIGFTPATLYLSAMFTQQGHQPVFLVPTTPSAFGYNLYALKPDPKTPTDHPLIATTFRFEVQFPNRDSEKVALFKVPIMHIHSPDPRSTPLPPVTLQITLPATVTPKLDLVFVSVPVSRLPTVVSSIPQVLHPRSAVISLSPCGALIRGWRYLHLTLDQLGFRHRQPMFVLSAIKSLNKTPGKSEVNPWDNKPKEDKVEKAEQMNRSITNGSSPPPLLLPAVTRLEAKVPGSPAVELNSDKARWDLLNSVHIVPEEGGIGARKRDLSEDANVLEPRGRGCVMIGHFDTSPLLLIWPDVFRNPSGSHALLPLSTEVAGSNATVLPRLRLLLSPDVSSNSSSLNTSVQDLASSTTSSNVKLDAVQSMVWTPPRMMLGEIDGAQTPRLMELTEICTGAILSTTGPTAPYPEADRPRTSYSQSSTHQDTTDSMHEFKAVQLKSPKNPREAIAKENAFISAVLVFLEYWTNLQKSQLTHQSPQTFVELISTSSQARLIFITILLEIANAFASINSPETLHQYAALGDSSTSSASHAAGAGTSLLDSVMDQIQRSVDLSYQVQPPARWGGYFWLVEMLQRVQSGDLRVTVPGTKSITETTVHLPIARLLPFEQLLVPPSGVLLPGASEMLLNSAHNSSANSASGFANCSRICACGCYEHLKVPLQLARYANLPHHFLLIAASAHQGVCLSRKALGTYQMLNSKDTSHL